MNHCLHALTDDKTGAVANEQASTLCAAAQARIARRAMQFRRARQLRLVAIATRTDLAGHAVACTASSATVPAARAPVSLSASPAMRSKGPSGR